MQVDALTQQNLQVLYDQQLTVQLKAPVQTGQSDVVPDMVAAVIKTTHGQLPNLKRILTQMHNVTFVIAQ